MKKAILLVAALVALAACTKDEVSVNPNELLFGEDAATLQLQIETNTDWVARADQPFVTISPSSGQGSMTVSVSITDNYGDPRYATITVTAGKAVNSVNVIQQCASPGFISLSFHASTDCTGSVGGATFTTKHDWTISAPEGVTFDKTSGGPGTHTVNLTTVPNESEEEKTYEIIFTAGDMSYSEFIFQSGVEPGFDKMAVNEDVSHYTGCEGTVTFETETKWSVTAPEGVTVDVASGNAGEGTVKYTTTYNSTSEPISYELLFKAGSGEEKVTVTVPAAIEKYGNDEYKVVRTPDGAWWFAEPLRYIPEGMSVSDNAADNNAHIWYPYTTDGTNTTACKDSESITKNGYIYDIYTALGSNDISSSNGASFEKCQGICPKGWHIPTRQDLVNLCGYSNKGVGESAALVKEDACFYDKAMNGGSIAKFNEGGWNFQPIGNRQKATFSASGMYAKLAITSDKTDNSDFVGKPAVTYVISSTYYNSASSNCQFFALMSTFTATLKGKLSVAYQHVENGGQVRCVRD